MDAARALERALAAAARRGDLPEAERLLAQGASPDAADEKGPALVHAAQFGHAQVLELLRDAGAQRLEARNELGYTALCIASVNGQERCVAALLEWGADADAAGGSGNTALHIAARKGELGCARLLVNAGADRAARNHEGCTALDVAQPSKGPMADLVRDPRQPRSGAEQVRRQRRAQPRGGGVDMEEMRRLREDARAAGERISQQLANMASVQKLLATSQVNLERDREYASRSIDLAIMSLADPAPDGEAGDAGGLAIAMLVKAPNLVALGTFVRYHAHIGFRRFSFFFDDIHDGADAPRCNDGAVAVLRELRDERVAEIVVHRCGRAWWKAAETDSEAAVWEQWGSHIWTEVTARQVVAIEVAIRESLAAGCRWLLHIDVDEALCCDGLQPTSHEDAVGAAVRFFERLPAALDQVTFLNHEAAPETCDVADWFKEITLFKRNPSVGGDKRHFVAYTNGKSAVRLAAGVVPAGPHRFTSVPPARRLQGIAVSDSCTGDDEQADSDGDCYPVLLHFVNCGFEEWRRKYKSLGTFGDSFCGKKDIPFKFHLASRDLLQDNRRRGCDTSSNWVPPPPTAGTPSPRRPFTRDAIESAASASSADGQERLAAARALYAQTMVHDCDSPAVRSALEGGELFRTSAVAVIVANM